MNSKECEEQLNGLIDCWNKDYTTRINATDIEAIKHLMLENQMQQDTIKTQKLVIGNLSERIDKAIEYIGQELLVYDNESDEYIQGLKIIEILKGEPNNE